MLDNILKYVLFIPRVFLTIVAISMAPLLGFLAMVNNDSFSDYVENAIESIWS